MSWGAAAVWGNSQETGWPGRRRWAGLGKPRRARVDQEAGGPRDAAVTDRRQGLSSRHRVGGTLKKSQGLAGSEGQGDKAQFPFLGWCVDANPWKGDRRAGVSGREVQDAKGNWTRTKLR